MKIQPASRPIYLHGKLSDAGVRKESRHARAPIQGIAGQRRDSVREATRHPQQIAPILRPQRGILTGRKT